MEEIFIFRVFQSNADKKFSCPDDKETLITAARWNENEIGEMYLYCTSCSYVFVPGFNIIEAVTEEVKRNGWT